METDIAIETPVPGEQIEDALNTRIGPAIDGLPVPVAVLSMLAACVLIVRPEISSERLQATIQDMCRYMMLSVTDLPVIDAKVN